MSSVSSGRSTAGERLGQQRLGVENARRCPAVSPLPSRRKVCTDGSDKRRQPRDQVVVDEQHRVAGIGDDVLELVVVQPDVDHVQHRTGQRYGEVELDVPAGVVGERRHPVPRLDAEVAQHGDEPQHPLGELGVGGPGGAGRQRVDDQVGAVDRAHPLEDGARRSGAARPSVPCISGSSCGRPRPSTSRARVAGYAGVEAGQLADPAEPVADGVGVHLLAARGLGDRAGVEVAAQGGDHDARRVARGQQRRAPARAGPAPPARCRAAAARPAGPPGPKLPALCPSASAVSSSRSTCCTSSSRARPHSAGRPQQTRLSVARAHRLEAVRDQQQDPVAAVPTERPGGCLCQQRVDARGRAGTGDQHRDVGRGEHRGEAQRDAGDLGRVVGAEQPLDQLAAAGVDVPQPLVRRGEVGLWPAPTRCGRPCRSSGRRARRAARTRPASPPRTAPTRPRGRRSGRRAAPTRAACPSTAAAGRTARTPRARAVSGCGCSTTQARKVVTSRRDTGSTSTASCPGESAAYSGISSR